LITVEIPPTPLCERGAKPLLGRNRPVFLFFRGHIEKSTIYLSKILNFHLFWAVLSPYTKRIVIFKGKGLAYTGSGFTVQGYIIIMHDNKPPIASGYGVEKKSCSCSCSYSNGFSTKLHVTKTNDYAEALAASLEDVGIRAKVEVWEVGAYYGNFFPRKFRGLIPYAGWYDVEYQAPSELSDFYLKGMPHTYYTTDEIDKAIREAWYSETDEELAVWGRKLSKLIRESHITTFLWARHTAYGLGPRIKSWVPTIGGLPACEFETLVLNE
jgi:hypothetical protein